MNREQAETLLAALVADELDEPMRGELLAYLKTDAAMAERLGDMRLAAGLLREGLEQASAYAPAALEESSRAELLAMLEREPITAEPAEGVSSVKARAGLGPLFTIRMAGGVAACVALGVGLVGLVLPELGEARRTARRMMSESPAAPGYAFDYSSNAPVDSAEVTNISPPYIVLSPYESGTLGLSQGDDIDLAGGTRVRYDELAFTDGQAGDLLSASSGTLVLGSELNAYQTTDANKALVATRNSSPPVTLAPDPDAVRALTEPLASLHPKPSDSLNGLNWQSTTEAGDTLARVGKPTGGTSRYGDLEPTDTGVFGAITLPQGLSENDGWKNGRSAKDPAAPFETQYGDSQLDVDGEFGPQPVFDPPRLDGRDAINLGGQAGEQAQGGAIQPGAIAFDKQWFGHVPRGKQHLGDNAAARGETDLRRIGTTDAPDEAVLPEPAEPAAPSREGFFSLELPAEKPDQAGALAETNGKLDRRQVIIDRNSAALQIAAHENASKDERLRQQAEQIEQQIALLSELQSQRSDLSLALIEERSRDRRLSDNYLRIQEENRALAKQLEGVPDFANAPGFDLNEALGNMASGGGSGNVPANDLMNQARANTAKEKLKQGDQALRTGQLNAAVQFYEDATLLAPDNTEHQDKLAEAKRKLKEQMRPLGVLDQITVDRTVDRQAAIAEYEREMVRATKALEDQDFIAANNAIIEARTTLGRERSVLDTTDYNARVERAKQLQGLAQTTQSRVEASQLKMIEAERSVTERQVASETERRKTEEVQSHLRKARTLQLEKKYDESLAELDAALFLEPDNAVIKGLHEMVQDTAVAVESFDLKRARDLEVASGTLLNIEATTPLGDILTYPGEWPELTAARLRVEEDRRAVVPEPAPEPELVPEAEDDKKASVVPPVNPWVLTEQDAQSTFALDTDTASYELARRTIREQAQLPPIASVRMEEFVNRFDYQYPAGRDAHDTFTVHADAGPAPFAGSSGGQAVLMKVGVRGRVVARDQMKPAHYVFVIDASGSMAREDRLPLVQQSLAMLLGQLGDKDTVSLVSYETRPYLLLEHAPASNAKAILDAAATIQTGGSTNLTEGLKLGYQVAGKHFASGGVNRVILCSDGVANVGSDDAKQMLDAVNDYRQHGVTLMTVGVGVDGQAASGAERFNDGLMEQLANRGDGQYVYLGSAEDAQRQFVEDLAATRPTIAFDAKIQVAFDPTRVRRYRLIGYENRDIADRDFRNDTVDAGEVGSGQSATALYELELWPTHRRRPAIQADEDPGRLATVYVRYRDARDNAVQETATTFSLSAVRERTVADDPRFYLAACAAEFAELLRNSEHAADGSFARLHQIAKEVAEALPLDKDAAELAELIGRSQGLPRAGQ